MFGRSSRFGQGLVHSGFVEQIPSVGNGVANIINFLKYESSLPPAVFWDQAESILTRKRRPLENPMTKAIMMEHWCTDMRDSQIIHDSINLGIGRRNTPPSK